MKPKRDVRTVPKPFLTFLTNTYRRPQGLAACLASVCRQTAVEYVEHVVVPDHLGLSPADAVYGRLPWYADAVRGDYVHVLGDDDTLAGDTVVAALKAFVDRQHLPPAVMVRVRKGADEFPKCGLNGKAAEGDVDLCCFVMRRDVFSAFARSYGANYKCDWDGYLALRSIAGTIVPMDLLFATGQVGGGRPEVDWA